MAQNPSFFLERAYVTGMEAADCILRARGLDEIELLNYPPPEPFVAWIESLMMKGRKDRRKKRKAVA